MKDINMVTISGEIVGDVKKGIAKNGIPFLIFRLKVVGYKPFFVTVAQFGEAGEFRAGDRVYVEGELQETGGKDGYPKTLEIVANFVQIEENPQERGDI